MKFMAMHKVDATMERGERPSQEIIKQMGQFIGGLAKQGVLVDGAGLHRSAARVRITFDAGTPTILRGPYTGDNELIASFALISTTGIEDAIARGTELGKVAGGREVEIGPVVEGWDLKGSPRPADAPHRFLLLLKANHAYEAGAAEPPAAVRALLDQWKREGVLQSDASLLPSKQAVRTKVTNGKRQWTDGPFAESKELIAGFAIFELTSLDEAKRLTEQYAAILGDNEVDVRELVH